MYRFGGGRVGL